MIHFGGQNAIHPCKMHLFIIIIIIIVVIHLDIFSKALENENGEGCGKIKMISECGKILFRVSTIVPISMKFTCMYEGI